MAVKNALKVMKAERDYQNSWQRIDAAYECYCCGYSIEEIAEISAKCTATIQKWLDVAETFPPAARSNKISPSTYMLLCCFPHPWEAAEFVLRHELNNLQVVYLYNAMRDYQRGERYFRSGVPFSLEEMAYRAKILPRPEGLAPISALTAEIEALKKENRELRDKLNRSEKIRLVYLKELGRKADLLQRIG